MRVVNISKAKNVFIYKITNTNEYLQIELGLEDIDTFISICEDINIRYELVRTNGLVPFLKRHRCRATMLISPIIVFLIITLLSNRLWQIEVIDNLRYTDEEIIRFINEKDVYLGCRCDTISCKQLEKELRANFEDIIWISIEKKGALLNIYIKENEGNTVQNESLAPTSIYSDISGTIYNIITRQGKALVHKGDIVNSGDLLVSGDIELVDDYDTVITHKFVKADADISILYDYEYTEQLPLCYESREYTNNCEYYNDIIINDIHLKLYNIHSIKIYLNTFFNDTLNQLTSKVLGKENKNVNNENTNLYYEINSFSSKNSLLSSLGIPHIINHSIKKEYNIIKKKYTDKEASSIINNKISLFLNNLSEKGIQIIQKDVKMYKDSEYIYAQISLKLISNKVIEKEIDITKNSN